MPSGSSNNNTFRLNIFNCTQKFMQRRGDEPLPLFIIFQASEKNFLKKKIFSNQLNLIFNVNKHSSAKDLYTRIFFKKIQMLYRKSYDLQLLNGKLKLLQYYMQPLIFSISIFIQIMCIAYEQATHK